MRRIHSWMEAPGLIRALGEVIFRLTGRRKSPGPRDLLEASRILVLRLDGIGDVVLTAPFLKHLRHSAPRARITLVVLPFVRNLVECCPFVDEVLIFDPRAPKFLQPVWRHWAALKFAVRELLPRRFDLTINPRWDADRSHATFLAYLSGAPRRAGYSEHRPVVNYRENRGWNCLLTDILHDTEPRHEVEYNAAVLRHLGATESNFVPELWLSEADRAVANAIWRQHDLRHDDLVVAFGLGAGEQKRIWPLSHFLEIAEWLAREYQAVILLAGGSDESAAAEEFQRRTAARIVNAAGSTTLRETAALLERAGLYVGNDTGAMHLAAAAGAKVLEISCHPENGAAIHPNSPIRFGPVNAEHRIVRPFRPAIPCVGCCRANQAHCILGVTVPAVRAAIVELLENREVHREALEYTDAQRR